MSENLLEVCFASRGAFCGKRDNDIGYIPGQSEKNDRSIYSFLYNTKKSELGAVSTVIACIILIMYEYT